MENTSNTETKQGCPKCGNEPRFCIKTGPFYRRKTTENPCTEVQGYLCKGCGYKGRGKMFNMTEEMGIEKEKAEIKIEPVVEVNDSD
jgi:hypothetical protein